MNYIIISTITTMASITAMTFSVVVNKSSDDPHSDPDIDCGDGTLIPNWKPSIGLSTGVYFTIELVIFQKGKTIFKNGLLIVKRSSFFETITNKTGMGNR